MDDLERFDEWDNRREVVRIAIEVDRKSYMRLSNLLFVAEQRGWIIYQLLIEKLEDELNQL